MTAVRRVDIVQVEESFRRIGDPTCVERPGRLFLPVARPSPVKPPYEAVYPLRMR